MLDKQQDEEVEGHLPSCGIDDLKDNPVKREGIVLGRLRFPGTASTRQHEQFRQYEQTDLRYSGVAKANHCPTNDLCFKPTNNTKQTSPSLSLQQIHLTGFGSHTSYDAVESTLQHVANQEGVTDFYMITTLREPGQYARKWYAFRQTWDAILPELQKATFEEWIDMAPWRMNVLTRMLGAQPDRLAMPKSLIYTKSGVTSGGRSNANGNHEDVLLKDEYMIQQNELGPKHSEVYATAVERLNGMVHFGLFHRLSETWQLMEHTFCWTMGYQSYRPDKAITGFDAIKKQETDEATAARIWAKLQEKNQLDIALIEEAERIFDERLEKMRREKADGIICNFLNRIEVRCADGGDASDEKFRRNY